MIKTTEAKLRGNSRVFDIKREENSRGKIFSSLFNVSPRTPRDFVIRRDFAPCSVIPSVPNIRLVELLLL